MGHMLHIDFAKVLGRAETLGGSRGTGRPFALTPDMVYLIRRSAGEAHFVRLCCDAYNVIRRNSNLLLALFSIMKYSGNGGRGPGSDRLPAPLHVARRDRRAGGPALRESASARAGESALRLSFNPRRLQRRGRGPQSARLRVTGIRLRTQPERLLRFPPTQSVVRPTRQFLELHSKMSKKFPECDFCPLSRGTVFSSDGDEATSRTFLDSVMALPDDVAHYRLMYSFFHPLPRDLELRDKVPITIAT
ncbi:hypothetical protein HPB48_017834 [Haemaphysalis longicornis]|uniref:PI3K/PI4K catalytic domain-containing protein n=1 Tax=Haemaphysalis longicornis TaxID=44386 RepID=A0A9J6G232_HAELO|nr:hypothetical protein HPB48_017834 [Haemaphysalis longicornis]